MKKIAVFASGNGSNFQVIAEEFPVEFVFSDHRDAYVLERADKLGVLSYAFELKEFENKADYEAAVKENLQQSYDEQSTYDAEEELITACVATAATSSTRFSLIPKNSADDSFSVNPAGFTRAESSLLIFIVSAIAAIAWVWCILLYVRGTLPAHIVAGREMFGIACVCTALIALVASIARQARGSYTMAEKGKWTGLVLTMGSLAFVLGLILIFAYWDHPINFVGFVLIGLALICWSISSKVILLAKIWHADFPLANRIPIIPVLTALACLFLAAFLYEEAAFQAKFFVPARVLSGFGAICFTLYSIVSILESGTSKK